MVSDPGPYSFSMSHQAQFKGQDEDLKRQRLPAGFSLLQLPLTPSGSRQGFPRGQVQAGALCLFLLLLNFTLGSVISPTTSSLFD